jgi:hypothetical protein
MKGALRGEEGANDCGGRPSSDCRKRTMGAWRAPDGRPAASSLLSSVALGRLFSLVRGIPLTSVLGHPAHIPKGEIPYDGVSWDLRRPQWGQMPRLLGRVDPNPVHRK